MVLGRQVTLGKVLAWPVRPVIRPVLGGQLGCLGVIDQFSHIQYITGSRIRNPGHPLNSEQGARNANNRNMHEPRLRLCLP